MSVLVRPVPPTFSPAGRCEGFARRYLWIRCTPFSEVTGGDGAEKRTTATGVAHISFIGAHLDKPLSEAGRPPARATAITLSAAVKESDRGRALLFARALPLGN